MKQKRSMDEALTAAKELRKNLKTTQPTTSSDANSHLKVIDSTTTHPKMLPPKKSNETVASETLSTPLENQPANTLLANPKPVWVRHTIGLRDTTSLSLRDAADGQKRKERYGQLAMGEPSNEQEIADLGMTLALKQLGYLN